jgi:hypothetical protein
MINSSMTGLIYPIEKHVGKGMMVEMLQNGILKLNHFLSEKLLKWKKACMS